jgi:DNA-binding CsgD family transcriptional regulator
VTITISASPSAATAGGRGLELFARASARLRRLVPFDSAGWTATDPATLLPTNPGLVENVVPGGCALYWGRELAVDDVLRYRDLAGSAHPGGTLGAATGGDPNRSARFRDLLGPMGYGDELRAAFSTGTSTWGVVSLLRERGRAPFTPRDVDHVLRLGPAMTSGLAGLAVADRSGTTTHELDGPGTALYDAGGTLLSLDDRAAAWFTELGGTGWETGDHFLMSTVSALVAEAGVRVDGLASAFARLRTPGGRWLVLHASRMRSIGGGASTTAVVVEPAKPAQVAPIVIEAFGLTPREDEITRAVARGLSNADIAASLRLSVHTVRDHLKAVFAKVDVNSRGELVATLFADRARTSPPRSTHVDW